MIKYENLKKKVVLSISSFVHVQDLPRQTARQVKTRIKKFTQDVSKIIQREIFLNVKSSSKS